MTRKLIVPIVVALAFVVGCDDQQEKGRRSEERVAERQLNQFLQSQPVPEFNSSQLRQNLIEIETAQANSTATTSFMFLLAGVGASGPLVHFCPSIGFPIPATYQLTNPQQKVSDGVVLPQLEANGVYTGDTTGTYVMCIGEDGNPFAFYHEGFVATVTGPAHWDTTAGEIVMDGPSSAKFTGAEG